MRFILTILLLSSVLMFSFVAANAQQLPKECDVAFEVITKLKKPELGSFSLWSHAEGERQFTDRYSSAASLPEVGQTLVTLERYAYERQDKKIILQEIDRRGRPDWEKELDLPHVASIVKMLIWNDQAVLVANMRDGDDRWVWIGFFDLKGELLSKVEIRDKKLNQAANDIIPGLKDKQLVLAVQSTSKVAGAQPYAILYWLNEKGMPVSDRAYELGMRNNVLKVQATQAGNYMLGGSIETSDGRMAGWIMNVEEDGAIRWQRQYARGRSARFASLDMMDHEKYVVVAGEAYAAEDGAGRPGGWIMVVDASDGEPAWQRFYREDGEVYGKTVNVQEDGQITFLMNVKNMDDKDTYDFVRLITLDPRGGMLDSRSYQNGVGASALGMIVGRKLEAIIFGFSTLVYKDENVEADGFKQEKEIRTIEAWLVAGAANDQYKDPCIRSYQLLP